MGKTLYIVLFFTIGMFSACKKEPIVNVTPQITIGSIVDSLTGNYIGIDYRDQYGSGSLQRDTLYNQVLVISKYNDSTIVANNSDTLFFKGDLAAKNYRFEWNYSSVYSNKLLWVDSMFSTITYLRSTDNGGFGGTNYSLCIER